MARIFITALLLLLSIAGCLPILPSPVVNEPPVAIIDTVSATKLSQGQTLSINGHGTDVGGTVVAYSWRSDIDGILSTSQILNTSSLSMGTHYIYFKVQDNSGDWSKERYVIINVVPIGAVKPTISNFQANPAVIIEGQNITLLWNVLDAKTVSIVPDVGDVPQQGSRVLTPGTNTTYKLTASNDAGTVSEETSVSVKMKSKNVREFYSIKGEEGSVDQNGVITSDLRTGVASSSTSVQAFFSFDISGIPPGSVITSASLDLTSYIKYGEPFSYLGAFGVFDDQYGVLDSKDYETSFNFDGISYSYANVTRTYETQQLINAVQQKVDARKSRFQIRTQFEKYVYFQMERENYLDFLAGKAKLIITYD